MRVLGVDPGSRYLGYGLVEWRGSQSVHVASGVVRTDPRAPLAEKLNQIFIELGQVLHVFGPQAVAVEGVFAHKNARSALVLGHARGVALLVAARAKLPVFEYAPARVKRSVGAGGNDTKGSVARMVTTLLHLPGELERADCYDALAVALCHLHQVRAGVSRPASVVRLQGVARRGANADFVARLKPSMVPSRRVAR
jgi:crossover junction endodeoxyribonuclease RuvC